MKRILLVLVMCCVVLASGCVDDDDPAGNDTAGKAECEEQGGEWDYVGLSPEKMCNLPTSDGGAECNGSAECEGDCIADLTYEELEKAWNGTTIYTSGLCTHWQLTVGCLPFVEEGKVEYVVCID